MKCRCLEPAATCKHLQCKRLQMERLPRTHLHPGKEQRSSCPESTPQTSLADANSIRLQERKSSKPTGDQLARLYSLYPRKRGKIEAINALRKAVTSVMAGDSDHSAMSLDDALDYLAQRITLFEQCVRGSDLQFIPYPATWLNTGSYWDDERDWKLKASPARHGTEKLVAQLPVDYVTPSAKMSRQDRAQIGGVQ